jgi:hypothetical protein
MMGSTVDNPLAYVQKGRLDLERQRAAAEQLAATMVMHQK